MSGNDVTVPAAEANRRFSTLLRAARQGARITITSHGEPVAQLIPMADDHDALERRRIADALAGLEANWASSSPRTLGAWTRDDLYERDEV